MRGISALYSRICGVTHQDETPALLSYKLLSVNQKRGRQRRKREYADVVASVLRSMMCGECAHDDGGSRMSCRGRASTQADVPAAAAAAAAAAAIKLQSAALVAWDAVRRMNKILVLWARGSKLWSLCQWHGWCRHKASLRVDTRGHAHM